MDHERITRYLLGELPGDEEAEIDASLLADDITWATVRQAEDELVDDFVLGRIDRARRTRIAARVAASPRLQERVAFARNLHVVALAPKPARRSISQFGAWFGTRSRQLALAGIGIAALLVAITWPRGGDPARPTLAVATLVLEPATRAAAVPSVAIEGIGVVNVTAVLDPEEVFPRYRLRLVGPRGTVWSADDVIGARAAVRAYVPVAVLAPGAYALELTGFGADGAAVALGSRNFRVTGPPQ
jgi:hypothetical protein